MGELSYVESSNHEPIMSMNLDLLIVFISD